jgi:aminobenzoyl-glutamate utilization protein A
MHSCGHDGHAAIGLATARILRPFLETGNGRLKILFQPAEEGGRGGRAVAEAGWMDDVDLFFAIHLGLGVPSDTAAFHVRGLLANARYDVTLTGRAAHAGKAPQEGRNALLAACQMVQGLHAMAQSSQPGTRVNVGLLRAGTAVNIVPEEAAFTFEMRAEETADLERLDRRCRDFVEATARAHGVECRMSHGGGAEGYSNPPGIADWAMGVNAVAAAFANTPPVFSFGASEDAATLANRVCQRGGTAGVFVLGADLARREADLSRRENRIPASNFQATPKPTWTEWPIGPASGEKRARRRPHAETWSKDRDDENDQNEAASFGGGHFRRRRAGHRTDRRGGARPGLYGAAI